MHIAIDHAKTAYQNYRQLPSECKPIAKALAANQEKTLQKER
jgi:hypothetical protein